MVKLKYGRYFVLNNEVQHVFVWLDNNIGPDWDIEVRGLCPENNSLVLLAAFDCDVDANYFDENYLTYQSNSILIYKNRRKPFFAWPISQERRGNIDRRQKFRRSTNRQGGRRLVEAGTLPTTQSNEDQIRIIENRSLNFSS